MKKGIQDVWDHTEHKLCVLMLGAEIDPDHRSKFNGAVAKVQSIRKKKLHKTLAKTKAVKTKSSMVTWNEFFFITDVDMCDYVDIRVLDRKGLSSAFVGSCTLFQIQTLQPHDEVVEINVNLESHRGKKDTKIIGTLRLRVMYSQTPETKIRKLNDQSQYNTYLYEKYMSRFRTGDLIFYSGYGITASLVQLITRTPFTSIGMIVRLPNKWTHQDELYVVEMNRNVDEMNDAFTDSPDIGFNVFKLYERIHQFHGTSVWWSHNKKKVKQSGYEELIKYITEINDGYKNINKKQESTFLNDSRVDSTVVFKPTLLDIIQPYLKQFGYGKGYSDFIEMVSADFIGRLLQKLGIYNFENTESLKIHDILNLDNYLPPQCIRVRTKYLTPSIIKSEVVNDEPVEKGISKKGISDSKTGFMNASSNFGILITDKDFSMENSFDHVDTRGRVAKVYNELNDIYSIYETDLFNIMKRGSIFYHFKKNGKPELVRIYLNEDEEELVCHRTRISVMDIDEIRLGQKTKAFLKNENVPELYEPLSFSILYGSRKKHHNPHSKGLSAFNFDVICLTDFDVKAWISGLNHLVKQKIDPGLAYIKKVYRKMNKKELNLRDTTKLLYLINIKAPKKDISLEFGRADKDKKDRLTFDEFLQVLKAFKSRPIVKELFELYSNKNQIMTNAQFLEFIHKEQREQKVSLEDINNVIAKFKSDKSTPENSLTYNEFEEFLSSGLNQILKVEEQILTQDMSQPLTHYYIASSHNTYLEGHQLAGISSAEQYIRVLKLGCRCLELDCWDGEDGNPIIFHGHTFTSKVKFEDVIHAINDYAFYSSPYPIILSFENHCSIPQQDKMVEILLRIFGDKIAKAEDRNNTDHEGFCPSPDFLKYKILIKGKMLRRIDEAIPSVMLQMLIKKVTTRNLLTEPKIKNEQKLENVDTGENIVEGLDDPDIQDIEGNTTSEKTHEKISEKLSQITYVKSRPFVDFQDAKEKAKPYEISSLSEPKTFKLSDKFKKEFIDCCSRYMIRVYPAGMRFNSSNYDCYYGWSAGCHMLALNYQTLGDAMFANEALFDRQGGCGYILKPLYMRDLTKKEVHRVEKIKVTILNASQLPKKYGENQVLSPYVQVSIIGHPKDNKVKRTSVVKKNGYSPNWNDTFEFTFAESYFAAIVFQVCDGNYLVAYRSLAVESLKHGYRCLALKDPRGKYIPCSSLFVKIDITKKSLK